MDARTTAADNTPQSSAANVRYVDVSTTRVNPRVPNDGPEFDATPDAKTMTGLPDLTSRRQLHDHAILELTSMTTSFTPVLAAQSMVLTASPGSQDESLRKRIREMYYELGLDDPYGQPPDRNASTTAHHSRVDEALLDDKQPALGLFRRRHIGLLISVVFASLLTSCLKRGVLPIMKTQLQMQSSQAAAAEILVMLPWSSMFVVGFFSDCFAVLNNHRKTYIVIGWLLTSLSLFILAIVSYAQERAAAQGNAASSGFVVGSVFLLGLACFGEILTVVMAEIYLIAMSKRELRSCRGEVVGTFLMIQTLCESIGQVITNNVVFRITDVGITPLYTLRQIVTFFAVYAIVPMISAAVFFHEDTTLTRPHFEEYEDDLEGKIYMVRITHWMRTKAHLKVVWASLQRVSTWHVVRFLVLFVFFSEFAINYAYRVLDEVAGVTVDITSSGKIIQELLGFGAVMMWRAFFLNVNWKWLLAIGFLVGMWLPQLVYFNFVLFDVSREVGIYTLVMSTKAFVRGLIVAVEVAMAIEIAPRYAEGAILGMIASIASIMRLLAATVSDGISFAFETQAIQDNGLDVGSAWRDALRIEKDPTTIQLPKRMARNVFMALIVCYMIKLIACSGIIYAPSQKLQLQSLHRSRVMSVRYAQWTMAILLASLVVAVTFNALVASPSTSCLKIFGGSGC